MGVITISINDEIEKKLRNLASVKFRKKGQLSIAITEALKEWIEKGKEEDLAKSLSLLERGIDMGGMISKKRADWHKR